MKGKGWLALLIAIAAIWAWRIGSRIRPADAPLAREVSVPAVDRSDLVRAGGSLDAAPRVGRVEDHPAGNPTVASGSTGRIHGHARDQDGRPLAGYPVWMIESRKKDLFPASVWMITGRKDYRVLGEAITGVDGAYEIRPVGPGDWLVGIVRSPEQGTGAEKDFYPLAQLVQCLPWTVDQEVNLVGYRGITIEGIVVTPDGEPVKGAIVEAMVEEDGPTLLEVGTDENGRFSLGALPPERFFLQASLSDVFLPSDTTSVTAGTKGVRLELVTGGHLVVSTVDEDSGEPLVASLIGVLREGRVDGGSYSFAAPAWAEEHTTFDVKGLEEGVYDLVARTKDGGIGIVRALNVEADGQAHEVVIRVGSSANLTLTCNECPEHLEVELYSDGALLASEFLNRGDSRSLLVPPGKIRLHVMPIDFQAEPVIGSSSDYWTRKDVWLLDTSAVLGEERSVELGIR